MFLTKYNSLETHVDNKFITSSSNEEKWNKKKLKYLYGSSPWGVIISSSEPSAVIRQPVFMNSFLANILSEESFLLSSQSIVSKKSFHVTFK